MNSRTLWLGRILLLISLAYLGYRIQEHLHDLPPLKWDFLAFAALFMGVSYSCTTVLISAVVWRILLLGGGVSLPLAQSFWIVSSSNIAKYLPGNVFQYLGRIAMALEAGIPGEAIGFSMGIDLLLIFTATLVVVGVGFIFGFERGGILERIPIDSGLNTVFLLAFCGCVLLLCLVFARRRLFSWIKPRASYIQFRRLLPSLSLYVSVFLLYGGVISSLMQGLLSVSAHENLHWFHYAWGFALAWFAGWIVPGAPGGLGIRETVMVEIFGRHIGMGNTLALALIMRLVTSLGDLTAFFLVRLFCEKPVTRRNCDSARGEIKQCG